MPNSTQPGYPQPGRWCSTRSQFEGMKIGDRGPTQGPKGQLSLRLTTATFCCCAVVVSVERWYCESYQLGWAMAWNLGQVILGSIFTSSNELSNSIFDTKGCTAEPWTVSGFSDCLTSVKPGRSFTDGRLLKRWRLDTLPWQFRHRKTMVFTHNVCTCLYHFPQQFSHQTNLRSLPHDLHQILPWLRKPAYVAINNSVISSNSAGPLRCQLYVAGEGRKATGAGRETRGPDAYCWA